MNFDQFLQALEIFQPGITSGIYPFTRKEAAVRMLAKRLKLDLTSHEGLSYADIIKLLFRDTGKCDNPHTFH